jgi:hypothetical protein
VWRLRVRREINVDDTEDHPLAVRRNLRVSDALELHHVVEGEGVLGLSESGKSKCEHEKREKKTAHEELLQMHRDVASNVPATNG